VFYLLKCCVLEKLPIGNNSEDLKRRMNYSFTNCTPNLEQTLVGFDLSWRIIKRLSLSRNYEGTFEDVNNYSRFYFNITKRF